MLGAGRDIETAVRAVFGRVAFVSGGNVRRDWFADGRLLLNVYV